MIIGAGLDARLGLTFDELSDVGETAAHLGFESLWTPAGGVPDSFHICAEWNRATRGIVDGGIATGISVVPAVRMWHVLALAAQAATVAGLSGGRFTLGIGTQGTGPLAALGLPPKPIRAMRDHLSALRGLLAGDVVSSDSPFTRLDQASLGEVTPARIGLAAMGPQMLATAGSHADAALLNWSTTEQIAWSRQQVDASAVAAGRSAGDVALMMYVRVCIDADVDAARRALAEQTLAYALDPPGRPRGAYRNHFGRMGFDEVLTEIEARRAAGASRDELVAATPDEMLHAVGYFGTEEGAAARFAQLAVGLDEVAVRVLTARPGVEPVLRTLAALTPARIRAAAVGRQPDRGGAVSEPTVVLNEAESRFELEVEGRLAELVVRSVDGHLVLVHTEVPEELGGQGLGGRLVQAAVDHAAAHGLVVEPRCAYARTWLERHPDEAARVTIDWPS